MARGYQCGSKARKKCRQVRGRKEKGMAVVVITLAMATQNYIICLANVIISHGGE